jgi:predicted alpha/beta superfamily hydrolase
MKRLARIAWLIATAALPLSARLEAQALPAAQPDTWIRLSVTSTVLHQSRELRVALPDDYATSTHSYPVLLLLDANDTPQFRSALTTVQYLSNRQAIPPMIVVGIVNGPDRTHDLTPPAGAEQQQFPSGGGSGPFLQFLTDEALPAVHARYRTTEFTVLAGHSFGGLFALWAAATHPGAFPAIIALSPSLWWDGAAEVGPYADSIAGANVRLRLFVANGGHEPTIDTPTSHFNALLDGKASPRLAFSHTRFPNASHGLVPLPGLIEGLQFVFQPVSLAVTYLEDIEPFKADSAQLVDIYWKIERHYAAGVHSFLPASLGVSDTLPEAYIRDYADGAQFLTHRAGPAAVILRRAAQLYPRSAGVHLDLAHALLGMADTTRAQAELTTAAALAAGDSALTRQVADEMRRLGGTDTAGSPRQD